MVALQLSGVRMGRKPPDRQYPHARICMIGGSKHTDTLGSARLVDGTG